MRSARAELLTALTVQWLTVRVSQSTATVPAVIVAGADEVTRDHLEALVGACEQRGGPLPLLLRHLREDAIGMIGGGATAFMRLGNHHEADQAASFIGRHHKFVLSGFTATRGGRAHRTRGQSESWGSSESRGLSATRDGPKTCSVTVPPAAAPAPETTGQGSFDPPQDLQLGWDPLDRALSVLVISMAGAGA